MRKWSLLAGSFIGAVLVRPVMAQQPETALAKTVTSPDDEIIVTGSRDPGATARKSLSPITVLGRSALEHTGQADLRDALVELSPSITRPRIATSAANFIDKVVLRALTSDQTLVLVNGKRRHTTSILSDTPGPERGTSPTDLGFIPQGAIDHIEVLQDGAAAQYGSDAIAGVINIILKSDDHGGMASTLNGIYYAGDGFNSNDSVNYGFRIKNGGFFNVTGEYRHQGFTDRGSDDIRVGYHATRYFGLAQTNNYNAGFNSAIPLGSAQFYAFGTYGYRQARGYQYYRLPSLLPTAFPNGFSPISGVRENDYSVTGGFKGGLAGWDWDVSATYGRDISAMNLTNSANQLLVKNLGNAQTDFRLGTSKLGQWVTDASLRRYVPVPLLAAPVNVALGGQFRHDQYVVVSGEPNSYYGGGTEGQSGLAPSSAISAGRNIFAGYVDLSTKLLPAWQIDASGRYEHYSDFGGALSGKVSTRYEVSPWLALRGTVSNGFRAPTMPTQYYTSVQVTSLGASALLSPNSPGGKYLGATPLRPEKSTNYSAGLVISPSRAFNMTVDAYQITIRNRILVGGVTNGAPAIAALALEGAAVNPSATASAVTAQFFTNGASTRTRGLDITANYGLHVGENLLDLRFSANFNGTEILSVANAANGQSLLNAQGRAYISSNFPKNKFILGAHYKTGRFDFDVSESRWGPFTTLRQYYYGPYANSVTKFATFHNNAEWETDLNASYQLTSRLKLSIGANNLFNQYPNRPTLDTVYAGVADFEQVGQGIGTNGGSYYGKLTYRF